MISNPKPDLMMRILSILCLLTLFQCNRSSSSSTDQTALPGSADNSRTSLDWAGTYRDTLPAADGPGILTTLTLFTDQTYTLATRYLEEDDSDETVSGDFDWRPDGGSISLLEVDDDNTPTYFQIAEGKVYRLDREGNRVEGPLAEYYALPKMEITLTGLEWQLRQINGEEIEATEGERPTLRMEKPGNLATGTGGCNTFRGNYQVVGDGLTFTPVASTKMACPALTTETAYFQALGEVQRYQIMDGRLSLFDEQGDTVLVLSIL